MWTCGISGCAFWRVGLPVFLCSFGVRCNGFSCFSLCTPGMIASGEVNMWLNNGEFWWVQRATSRNLIISILCSYRLVLSNGWATDAMGRILLCFYFKVFLLVPDGKPSRPLFIFLSIQQTKHAWTEWQEYALWDTFLEQKKLHTTWLKTNCFTFYGEREIIMLGYTVIQYLCCVCRHVSLMRPL